MKCKWCGVECYFVRDSELGGGGIFEKKTNQPHLCKPFNEWAKSINLDGPTLSYARYQLWLLGPEEAGKRVDLQKEAMKPLLPEKFFARALVVDTKDLVEE